MPIVYIRAHTGKNGVNRSERMLRKLWNIRWVRRLMIAMAVIVVLVAVVVPMLVSAILKHTLQKMVASQLNAQLEIGSLSYHYPLEVEVHEARLLAQDEMNQAVALLEVGGIVLDLAKLPFGSGPMVIRELVIEDPVVRIIQTHNGVVGSNGLVKDTGPSDPNMKLSDMFELRRVAMTGARFVYEDRREKDHPSVEWKDIGVDLRTHPTTKADYAYEFRADNLSTATVQAKGMMNIDTLFFELEKFVVEVRAEPGKVPAQIPPSLQSLWKQYAISGKLKLEASGKVPLAQLDQCSYQASLDLQDASAFLAGAKTPLDSVNIRMSVDNQHSSRGEAQAGGPTTIPTTQQTLQPINAPVEATIDAIEAGTGDMFVKIKRGQLKFDPKSLDWSVSDVAGRVSLPLDRPKVLADIPGPMQGVHMLGNLPIRLTGSGRFAVAGPTTAPTTAPAPDDYKLNLSINGGNLAFTSAQVPLDKIKANLALDPTGLRITDFSAVPMNGKLQYARGQLLFNDHMDWEFAGSFRDMDMSLLGPALVDDPVEQKRFSGKGNLIGRAYGELTGASSAAQFRAAGEATIVDGNFFQIGVVKGVTNSAKVDRNGLTVGELAAEFAIVNRKILLENAAISAPAIGVQGSGTVGFDGDLDLNLILSPFGDWKKGLEKSEIPILSDVGAAIAGGVQEVTKGVTRTLLYECHVTGPAGNPEIKTFPAPALTGQLFDEMKENKIEQKRLLDAIKKMPPKKPTTRSTTRPATRSSLKTGPR